MRRLDRRRLLGGMAAALAVGSAVAWSTRADRIVE
jgi:hypothetical protein